MPAANSDLDVLLAAAAHAPEHHVNSPTAGHGHNGMLQEAAAAADQ